MNPEDRATGPSHGLVEGGVAVAMIAFGLIVVLGSLRVGINWGAEGPKAGFFPFYLGLTIIGASIANFVRVWRVRASAARFATWRQLRQVMSVLVPTAVYVVAIPLLGIYVSSALLIALFMTWLGRNRAVTVLAISIATPMIVYIVFEGWFLLPLPKGPIEEFFGL